MAALVAAQDKMVPLQVLAHRDKAPTVVVLRQVAVVARLLRVQYIQEELALLRQSQALPSHALAAVAADRAMLLYIQVAQAAGAMVHQAHHLR
jgi:hypothetical protein